MVKKKESGEVRHARADDGDSLCGLELPREYEPPSRYEEVTCSECAFAAVELGQKQEAAKTYRREHRAAFRAASIALLQSIADAGAGCEDRLTLVRAYNELHGRWPEGDDKGKKRGY